MMFDTEKFIVEIEKRPVIWRNSEKATTGDRDLKQRAWDEVGAEMYLHKWHLFSDHDKMEKSKGLYKKWKNIRDYFLKELKTQRKRESGKSVPKHKKYVYFDMLKFLIPVIESKKMEGDGNDFDNTIAETPLPEITKTVQFAQLSHKKQETTPVVNNLHEQSRWFHTADKQKKTTDDEEVDADKAFFMSLLPVVKKLDDQQKLDLKLEVLQALKRLQNSDSSSAQTMAPTNIGFHNLPPFYQCTHCQSFSSILPRTSKTISLPSSSFTSAHPSSTTISTDLMDTSESMDFKHIK